MVYVCRAHYDFQFHVDPHLPNTLPFAFLLKYCLAWRSANYMTSVMKKDNEEIPGIKTLYWVYLVINAYLRLVTMSRAEDSWRGQEGSGMFRPSNQCPL